jgi:hypothetical protein
METQITYNFLSSWHAIFLNLGELDGAASTVTAFATNSSR